MVHKVHTKYKKTTVATWVKIQIQLVSVNQIYKMSVFRSIFLRLSLQVYLFAEALAEGAVKMGMPSVLAHSIASQTVLVSLCAFVSPWQHRQFLHCLLWHFLYVLIWFLLCLLQGAGRLLRDSGKHPAQLRSEVCTPGGTTIYGLHTLEQGGVRASTMSAVESATERARELGRKSAAGCRKWRLHLAS